MHINKNVTDNQKETLVKLDSRNRISLTKITSNLAEVYRVVVDNDRIILEPIREIPQEERWLFDPANKHLVEGLKKALEEKATISFDEAKKKLKWS